jgi:hypothetical protein
MYHRMREKSSHSLFIIHTLSMKGFSCYAIAVLSINTIAHGWLAQCASCSQGDAFHCTHRQSIMLVRQEGLTKSYNRFHDPLEQLPDIIRLRQLHKEMDEAVAHAYGWDDLKLEHGFHETKQGLRYTISEAARREVLDRLLLLNHERYEEEVKAGLFETKGAKGKGRKGGVSEGVEGDLGQGMLF